jgi:hypothetical protein
MSTPYLFRVTSLSEVAAGLALLAVPAVVIKVVLGVDQAHPEALVLGRLGGAALLAIGVACWAAQGNGASSSQRGLLRGAFIYNIGAVAVLGYAGSMLALAGVLLWPTGRATPGSWCVVPRLSRWYGTRETAEPEVIGTGSSC